MFNNDNYHTSSNGKRMFIIDKENCPKLKNLNEYDNYLKEFYQWKQNLKIDTINNSDNKRDGFIKACYIVENLKPLSYDNYFKQLER
jgi:hypothetical protein